jgi:uncharacterized protein YqgC (DUF456 family)
MNTFLYILLWVVASLLVAGGLAGIFFPVVPGGALIFAGLAVAAWADHFAYVGMGTLALLALLALLTHGVDFAAGSLGARRFGAGKRAVAGAALGAVVGIFFGLPGIFLGPFVGAVLGELSDHRTVRQAGRAGIGAWLGLILGMAGKLALSFAMLGVFAAARLMAS